MMKKIKALISKFIKACKPYAFDKSIRLTCIFLFAASLTFFIAGATHSSTKVYSSAIYYSEAVKNNDGVNFLPLIVEEKDEEHKLIDTATEFRSLYGAFGSRITNFAGTVNADKENNIYFSDIETENLSFVYAHIGFSNSPEKEGTKYYGGYRHEFYPLHLMYKGTANKKREDYSFLYLSQSQADKIIAAKPEYDNYDDLINESINLEFNGEVYSWTIDNIYLEEDYFYNAVTNVMGEFLLGYRYYPEGFNKQATYFLNQHEYENKFFIEYATAAYSPSHYTYKTSNYRVDVNEKVGLSFAGNDYDVLTYFILLGAFVLIGFGCFFIIKNRYYHSLAYCLYFVLCILLPYAFFHLLFVFLKNTYIFSPFATIAITVYLIALVLFLIIFAILFAPKRKVICDSYYHVKI